MTNARSNRQFGLYQSKPFKVVVCTTTLVAFLFNIVSQDIAWAAGASLGSTGVGSKDSGSPGFSVKEFHVDTFALPEYLGRVKDFSKGRSSNVVIHIQDAHCNYDAQRRIAQIVEYLNKEYGINTINLEGGARDYDLSLFTNIDDKALRDKASDHFVKEGLVNGAEYFAINNPDKVTLWGVEDTKLYIDNLKAYRDSLKYKDEIDRDLKALTHILINLKLKIYSKELLELDTQYSRYKAGSIEFKEYLKYLIAAARKRSIDVTRFNDLSLLDKTLEAENAIDFKKANNERDELVDRLQRKMSKSSFEALVLKTVEFKTEKISQKEFYDYLLKRAYQVGMDLNAFPDLQKYAAYVSTYSAIDNIKVMDEVSGLEAEIKESLYENDRQRQLGKLSKNLAILKNIFNISLTRDDYKYYLANKDSFDMANYVSFINREVLLYKITATLDNNIADLDSHREEIVSFYEYSLKRDGAFLKNLHTGKGLSPLAPSEVEGKGTVPGQDSGSAILITGGFHTENLAELFKKNNISYISIMPNFKNCTGYACPYFKLLSGEKSLNIKDELPSVINKSLAIASPLNQAIVAAVTNANEELKGEARKQSLTEEPGIISAPTIGNNNELLEELRRRQNIWLKKNRKGYLKDEGEGSWRQIGELCYLEGDMSGAPDIRDAEKDRENLRKKAGVLQRLLTYPEIALLYCDGNPTTVKVDRLSSEQTRRIREDLEEAGLEYSSGIAGYEVDSETSLLNAQKELTEKGFSDKEASDIVEHLSPSWDQFGRGYWIPKSSSEGFTNKTGLFSTLAGHYMDQEQEQSIHITNRLIALRIIKLLIDCDVEEKFFDLFSEPEMSLRYKEFVQFYATLSGVELKHITPKELRQMFIKYLGYVTVYRAEQYDKSNIKEKLSDGLTSTYYSRFESQVSASIAIKDLINKYGIGTVLLSSVFREDLPGGELTNASKKYPDYAFLSVSEIESFALGIGRAYDLANKREGSIALYEIKIPRFYLIDYDRSSILKEAMHKDSSATFSTYFKDIRTNEVVEIAGDDPRKESMVCGSIPAEWIQKVTLYPLRDNKGRGLSTYWGKPDEEKDRGGDVGKSEVIFKQSKLNTSSAGRGTAKKPGRSLRILGPIIVGIPASLGLQAGAIAQTRPVTNVAVLVDQLYKGDARACADAEERLGALLKEEGVPAARQLWNALQKTPKTEAWLDARMRMQNPLADMPLEEKTALFMAVPKAERAELFKIMFKSFQGYMVGSEDIYNSEARPAEETVRALAEMIDSDPARLQEFMDSEALNSSDYLAIEIMKKMSSESIEKIAHYLIAKAENFDISYGTKYEIVNILRNFRNRTIAGWFTGVLNNGSVPLSTQMNIVSYLADIAVKENDEKLIKLLLDKMSNKKTNVLIRSQVVMEFGFRRDGRAVDALDRIMNDGEDNDEIRVFAARALIYAWQSEQGKIITHLSNIPYYPGLLPDLMKSVEDLRLLRRPTTAPAPSTQPTPAKRRAPTDEDLNPKPHYARSDDDEAVESGGLIGKVYDAPPAQEGQIVVKVNTRIEGDRIYLTSESGAPLYDKHGEKIEYLEFEENALGFEKLAPILHEITTKIVNAYSEERLSHDEIKVELNIAKSLGTTNVFILKDNRHGIYGLPVVNEKRIFINESLLSPMVLFHELGEAYFADNPELLPQGLTAHAYLRGDGAKERERNPNGFKRGLQDKIFGEDANNEFTESIKKSLGPKAGAGSIELDVNSLKNRFLESKELEVKLKVIAGLYALATNALVKKNDREAAVAVIFELEKEISDIANNARALNAEQFEIVISVLEIMISKKASSVYARAVLRNIIRNEGELYPIELRESILEYVLSSFEVEEIVNNGQFSDMRTKEAACLGELVPTLKGILEKESHSSKLALLAVKCIGVALLHGTAARTGNVEDDPVNILYVVARRSLDYKLISAAIKYLEIAAEYNDNARDYFINLEKFIQLIRDNRPSINKAEIKFLDDIMRHLQYYKAMYGAPYSPGSWFPPASIFGPSKTAALGFAWWSEELARMAAYTNGFFGLFNVIFVFIHCVEYWLIKAFFPNIYSEIYGSSPPTMSKALLSPTIVTVASMLVAQLNLNPWTFFAINAAIHLIVNYFAIKHKIPPASLVPGGRSSEIGSVVSIKEREADQLLLSQEYVKDIEFLQDARAKIRIGANVPADIGIFFVMPEDHAELFRAGDGFGVVGFKQNNTQIHIPVNFVINRGVEVVVEFFRSAIDIKHGKNPKLMSEQANRAFLAARANDLAGNLLSTPEGASQALNLQAVREGLWKIAQVLFEEGKESVYTCALSTDYKILDETFYASDKARGLFTMAQPKSESAFKSMVFHSHPFIAFNQHMSDGGIKTIVRGDIIPGGDEFDRLVRAFPVAIMGLVWGNAKAGFYLTVVAVDGVRDYKTLISKYGSNLDAFVGELSRRGAVKFYKILPVKEPDMNSGKGGINPTITEISTSEALAVKNNVLANPKLTIDDDARIIEAYRARAAQEFAGAKPSIIDASIKEEQLKLQRMIALVRSEGIRKMDDQELIILMWESRCVIARIEGLNKALEISQIGVSRHRRIPPAVIPEKLGMAMRVSQGSMPKKQSANPPFATDSLFGANQAEFMPGAPSAQGYRKGPADDGAGLAPSPKNKGPKFLMVPENLAPSGETAVKTNGQILANFLAARQTYGVASNSWTSVPDEAALMAAGPFDVVILMGSEDERVPGKGAAIIKRLREQSPGLKVVTSGKWADHPGESGKFYDAQGHRISEAERFAQILEAAGVKTDIIEGTSTNTGENIQRSRDRIIKSGFKAERILILQIPVLQLRAGRSAVLQYPTEGQTLASMGVKSITSYSPYIPDLSSMNSEAALSNAKAFLEELGYCRRYANKFMVPVEIPQEVLDAEKALQALIAPADMSTVAPGGEAPIGNEKEANSNILAKFDEWQRNGNLEGSTQLEQDEAYYLRRVAKTEFPDDDPAVSYEFMSRFLKNPEDAVEKAERLVREAHEYASSVKVVEAITIRPGLTFHARPVMRLHDEVWEDWKRLDPNLHVEFIKNFREDGEVRIGIESIYGMVTMDATPGMKLTVRIRSKNIEVAQRVLKELLEFSDNTVYGGSDPRIFAKFEEAKNAQPQAAQAVTGKTSTITVGARKNIGNFSEMIFGDDRAALLRIAKERAMQAGITPHEVKMGFNGNRVGFKTITIGYDKDDEVGRCVDGEVAGSFNVAGDDGYTYIFIQNGLPDAAVAIQHEELEIGWREMLKNSPPPDDLFKNSRMPPDELLNRMSHILAWANQIISRDWTNVKDLKEDTNFVETQIDELILKGDLDEINLEDRTEHYKLIEYYLGKADVGKVTAFENSVREYAFTRGVNHDATIRLLKSAIEGRFYDNVRRCIGSVLAEYDTQSGFTKLPMPAPGERALPMKGRMSVEFSKIPSGSTFVDVEDNVITIKKPDGVLLRFKVNYATVVPDVAAATASPDELKARFERLAMALRICWHGGARYNMTAMFSKQTNSIRQIIKAAKDERFKARINPANDESLVAQLEGIENDASSVSKTLEGMHEDIMKIDETPSEEIVKTLEEKFTNAVNKFNKAHAYFKSLTDRIGMLSVKDSNEDVLKALAMSDNQVNAGALLPLFARDISLKEDAANEFEVVSIMINKLMKNFMQGSLEPKRLNLSQLVDDALNSLWIGDSERLIKRKKFSNNVSKDIEVYADENLLTAALARIISNGSHFSASATQFSVSASLEDGSVVIRIEDDSSGFSEKALNRTIMPDRPNACVLNFSGKETSGLGLAFAAAVFADHGATMELSNNSNLTNPNTGVKGGVCHIIRMPVAHAAPAVDTVENRHQTTVKVMDADGRDNVVKVVVGVPVGMDMKDVQPVLSHINRELAEKGFGDRNDSKQVITFVIDPDQQVTAKNQEDAMAKAREELPDNGRIILFSPQMENGPKLAKSIASQDNVTVIPDAYSDANPGEGLYPDLMIRVALARKIAFWYSGNEKETTFAAIKEFLSKVAANDLSDVSSLEKLLEALNKMALSIRPVDYNKDIKVWASSHKAVSTAL